MLYTETSTQRLSIDHTAIYETPLTMSYDEPLWPGIEGGLLVFRGQLDCPEEPTGSRQRPSGPVPASLCAHFMKQ